MSKTFEIVIGFVVFKDNPIDYKMAYHTNFDLKNIKKFSSDLKYLNFIKESLEMALKEINHDIETNSWQKENDDDIADWDDEE